jgi:hypothetical protein
MATYLLPLWSSNSTPRVPEPPESRSTLEHHLLTYPPSSELYHAPEAMMTSRMTLRRPPRAQMIMLLDFLKYPPVQALSILLLITVLVTVKMLPKPMPPKNL